jgi:glycosyltransferase involved in cell wall biosynthesis
LALVSRMGLSDVVEVGGIPPSQRASLSTLLATASLVTLLSDYEAHPVSVMEALALGCPVLTTNCTGFIELIEDGVVKAVSLDASAEDISNAVTTQLAAPRASVSVDLPSWSSCADDLLTLYRLDCAHLQPAPA